MRRKILLTLLLYTLGASVYLSLSLAPLRVHVVVLPFHFVFLLLALLIASASSLSRQRRGLALAVLVLLGSILQTILFFSECLFALYFVVSFALLGIELFVVLGLVWLLERALILATGRR